jgi:DNA polymerase III subunit delta'
MAFAEIIGHARVKVLLERAVTAGRLPPALLFAGPEGVGKRTLAIELGRLMLCEGPEPRPCGSCVHCQRIGRALHDLPERRAVALENTKEETGLDHRLHPDLMLVEAWRTANKPAIKLDQARDVAREILGLPFEARARVFVVDDAHALTEPAMNSLLKSLEEPPATSHVILVTPAPQALLATIRSRCQLVRFERLPLVELERHLRDERGLTPDEARLRAVLSAGSLGAALAFESGAYRDLRAQVIELLELAAAGGGPGRLDAAERLAEGDDPGLTLMTLRSLLRDVLVLRNGGGEGRLLNADVVTRLEGLAAGPLGPLAGELADATGEIGEAVVRGNAQKLLSFDLLFERLAPRV